MEAREEAVRLPNKINNQGTVPTLQRVSVLLNAYQMDLKQTINEVYQFEVRFVGERIARRKGQEQTVQQDFSRGPRNDEAKETRRRLLWQLFQQLLAQNPDFFGNEKRIFTYDCALLLFCTNDLRMAINQNRQFIVNVDRTALEPRCNSYIRNTERITANLVRTGTIDMKNAATAYIQGDRSVVHFLELLTSQRMFEQGQHYCFGNRMYEQEDVIPLGGGRGQNDPRILKRGMQKNVRFVGDNMRNAQPIVQIDPKKSAFFPNMGLLEFIGRFLECANPQQMERNFQNYFNKANKQIRGLVLETTHLPQNQVTFSTVGLTTQSANEITFEREGQRVSVAQHFQDTYQLALRYPRLPCVIHRMPQKRESYFPIEYVRIVQGQRIPIDKQTPNLTEQMIRQCQVLPENLAAQIDEQRDKGMIQSGNPFFRAHNVRVDTNLIKSEGALLFPPAIQYEPPGDVVEPDQRGGMRWSMIGGGTQRRQYPIPAKWPKPWAVVIMQNAVGMDQCRTFCQRMVENARQRGLADANMPQRVDQFEDTSLEFMNEKFEFFSQHSCMFVLFFAPGKRNAHPGDIHHVMKLMEQRHNVLTQHISPEIMNKGAGQGGGAAMVVENILFKTNLKLGGANYHLVTSNLFKQANRNQQDILGNIWLSGNRMFFGIAMSHAPPQSLYERQAGKAAAIPTVVGMAYTIGKAMLQMRGTYWMQQPRLTTMSDEHRRPFINAIRNALQIYESNNGKYPEHVIVYRGGASEGEFKRVCYWEGAAFIEAFREIRNQNRAFQPPAVTIIVCQRQSNYRIIPERVQRGAKAPDQNVQPGTIVDKGAMNAALTEFLLVAHKALQGTAQPVRCTIIYEWRPDEGPAANIQKQIPLEEIENMTNALCYSHGICCMSTAVPGVLYSADELAKRGRNNWKMHSGDGETVPQFDLPPLGEGHEQAQQQLNEQRAAYFADISERLNPRIPTKFWA